MDKPIKDENSEKPTTLPFRNSSPMVKAWHPQTIPGRRPLLSGKIKFTTTRAVPAKPYK